MNEYKHILVGVDFSDVTDRLLDKAVRLSEIFNATITLIHVIDYLPPSYVAAELPNAFVSEAVLMGHAKKQITESMKRHPNIDYQSRVIIGGRKKSIVALAEEINADLVILGKHDPLAMDRFLGSTTLGVINRSSFDVLVVHA